MRARPNGKEKERETNRSARRTGRAHSSAARQGRTGREVRQRGERTAFRALASVTWLRYGYVTRSPPIVQRARSDILERTRLLTRGRLVEIEK